jgi:hypothetical protein
MAKPPCRQREGGRGLTASRGILASRGQVFTASGLFTTSRYVLGCKQGAENPPASRIQRSRASYCTIVAGFDSGGYKHKGYEPAWGLYTHAQGVQAPREPRRGAGPRALRARRKERTTAHAQRCSGRLHSQEQVSAAFLSVGSISLVGSIRPTGPARTPSPPAARTGPGPRPPGAARPARSNRPREYCSGEGPPARSNRPAVNERPWSKQHKRRRI